jgi:Kef-type K+ transport system membrane component KefB
MQTSLFASLSLIIVLAVAVAAVMRTLRQPLIIGYILTGVLIGPSFLHLIPGKSSFDAFSSIGIALLLFIIGLGLNTAVIKRLGKVVVGAASAQMLISAAAGYIGALLLGFTPLAALVVGIALSFSSTIIIIKLFTDKREQSRLYAQISIGILLLQDIVASIVLVVLAAGQHGEVSAATIGLLTLKGAGLGLGLFIVSGYLLPLANKFVAGSQEFLFLFALAWGFGIATLFEAAGFSIEVGALFAGVSLASLPYAQEVAARLKPLRDFFVVVFFIALGEGLQLGNISSVLLPAIVFSVVVVIIKPLVVFGTMELLGYTKRTSFKAAVPLGQVSEFSLVFVVVAISTGLITAEQGAAITLVAIVTIAISTYLIKYDDELFAKLETSLRFFERKTAQEQHAGSETYPLVLFGFRKGGDEFVKSFKTLHRRYVVVDYDPEVIEDLEHYHINHMYGDATDLELLQEIGIEKAKLVISTITDHQTNQSLVRYITSVNTEAIIICQSESYEQAAELYHLGAAYVMMPHLIGSERISSFIQHAGLNKRAFTRYRDQHLMLLEQKAQEQQ